MIKNISDNIYKNLNFKVSSLLFVSQNNSETINQKFKKNDIIKFNKQSDGSVSINLDTYNKLMLGFCSIPPNTSEYQGKIGESIYFTQRFFHEIDSCLLICLDWLRSKHYKYLFNISPDGTILGLGSPPPVYPAIYKNQTEFIRFHPAVVRDFNNNLSEGVGIRTNNGALTQMTCIDFLNMSMCVRNYIANNYTSTIQLINLCATLSKSK